MGYFLESVGRISSKSWERATLFGRWALQLSSENSRGLPEPERRWIAERSEQELLCEGLDRYFCRSV